MDTGQIKKRCLNTYDVYKREGTKEMLVAHEVDCIEASNITGFNTRHISAFAEKGDYHRNDYKVIKVGNKVPGKNGMSAENRKRWDDRHNAYLLLVSGQGEIVTVNGRKYVRAYEGVTI